MGHTTYNLSETTKQGIDPRAVFTYTLSSKARLVGRHLVVGGTSTLVALSKAGFHMPAKEGYVMGWLRRRDKDQVIENIAFTTDDPEWYAGSFLTDDGDPATIIIPINTLAGMTDAQKLAALDRAVFYAQQNNAIHIAVRIDHHIRNASRDQINWLVDRLITSTEYTPVKAALAQIKLHLERQITKNARPGYIYLVEGRDCYKIGKSKDAPKRTRTFGLLLPFQTRLIHTIPTSDMAWAEAYLHQTFADVRLNGEWFELGYDDVSWICELTELEPA